MSESRQNRAKIIEILSAVPLGLTATEVANKTSLPKRSIQRMLADLVKEKKIVRTGKGPSTKYKSAALLPIPYQRDFLKRYNPSKQPFFTQAESRALSLLGSKTANTIDLATYSARIHERLIIDLSWSSSKFEGNTYSLLETEKLLSENLTAQGKDHIETQMILNHKEAIKFIISNHSEVEFNGFTVKNVHALLSEELLKNPAAGGALRKIPVGIEGSRYIPLDVPQQINDEFEFILKKHATIRDPFERALFILIFIPYLQPFEDLNKRTSRVCCNIPLIKSGLTPVSFVNIDTQEYIDALKDIYEFNDILKMMNLFMKAYQYSAERYRLIKTALQAPDPIAVRYRDIIKSTVRDCVLACKKPGSLKLSGVKKDDKKKYLK